MNTFKAEMIAPCGLDCNICSQALDEQHPCPGCFGPKEQKPHFCAVVCGIVRCRKRSDNGYKYCNECPDYPCEDVMEKETRYTSTYPLRESPLENLSKIKDQGIYFFLEEERKQWSCNECGGIISVHTGRCSACGR